MSEHTCSISCITTAGGRSMHYKQWQRHRQSLKHLIITPLTHGWLHEKTSLHSAVMKASYLSHYIPPFLVQTTSGYPLTYYRSKPSTTCNTSICYTCLTDLFLHCFYCSHHTYVLYDFETQINICRNIVNTFIFVLPIFTNCWIRCDLASIHSMEMYICINEIIKK